MKNKILYLDVYKKFSFNLYKIVSKAFNVLLLLMFVNGAIASPEDEKEEASVVLETTLNMLCFPPNNPQNTPPCPVPVGLDPSLVASSPTGKMKIEVRADDTATFTAKLDGLQKAMVVTAWFVHFPPNQPQPNPIFAPIGPGLPAVALIDSPLAATTAAYSEGLSTEPNQLYIKENGSARLKAKLDYNPLKSNQVPLVNSMVTVNQILAPAGSVAEQGNCCDDFPAGPRPEPIGGSYLRKFNQVTGTQMKDANGRPMLVRSPGRPVAIAVFVHIDGTTSGMVPGVPTPPFLVNPPSTTGTFYLLGLFPLGSLGMDSL